jgi:small GTP-binding protein
MGGMDSKLKSKSTCANVLVVGLSGAGKTSLLSRVSGGGARHLLPTHGCSLVRLAQHGFKLNCLDLGGSVSARSSWSAYYARAHAIIFVIDAADRCSLERAGTLLQDLLDQPRLLGLPLLILANKQDQFSAATGTEISNGLNCSQIRGRLWQIQQTSAVTSEGLQVAFEWLNKTLAEKSLTTKEMKRINYQLAVARLNPKTIATSADGSKAAGAGKATATAK